MSSEFDLAVKLAVYRQFAAAGVRPSPDEIAERVGADPGAVLESYRRLRAQRVLVLEADGAARKVVDSARSARSPGIEVPVTPDGFRRMALALPEASEGSHMGHADFRVGGKIFATLGYPEGRWGMVKLQPDQQEALVGAEPAVFSAVKGGWGRRGATSVRLAAATRRTLGPALVLAYRNVAPRRLAQALGAGSARNLKAREDL